MTNIKDLARTLRQAAEEELMCREASDTSDLWQDEAGPENVLALVEALEKAQKLATQQGNIACALFDEVTAQRNRIAELENSESQLIQERDDTEEALADMYQAATGERPEWSNAFGFADAVDAVEQRLGYLESRTVTVKPPEIERPIDGAGYATAAGERRYKERVIDALRAAGIRVIEGEQKNG